MIDVTERIKNLTNNYKITKKENLPAFVDICKQLKYTSAQADSIRLMRMECTKVLNSTVKKNILRDFLTMDGLSILSEWITNCSDHVDETMLKELISIVSKLNECGGLDVSHIKKAKIGKILSSISKSTNFSKTIKTSVDELIQDWKQKFVKESPPTPTMPTETSPTIPKKKPSTPSTGGEKRKRADDQTSPQEETPNRTDSVETVPKKVKSEELSKKKKRVSWSTELEKVRLIEPRQAYVEEVNHRSVQELMNEEKSNERVLMNQQKQMKIMILSNMRNTVNYVTPLRILLPNDKMPPVEVVSNEAKVIEEMVRSSPSIIVTESPSSPVPSPTESSVTNLLNTIGIINSPTTLNSTSNRFPTSTPNPITITNPPPPSPYQQPPPNYSNNSYPMSSHQSPYQHQTSPYQRSQPPVNQGSYYQNRPSHVPPPQQHNYHSQHSYQTNNSSGGQKNKPPTNQYSNNKQPLPPPPVQHQGEPRSFKPIKCLYFVKGQCKNGTKCPFYHEGYDQPVAGIEDYDFEKARFYQALREKKR